jgi:hypothetical protein
MPSKGMRKHMRKKKAEEAKRQSIKETGQIKQRARKEAEAEAEKERLRLEKLPAYLSFPKAKFGGSIFGHTICPNCELSSYIEKITIETKQGIKPIGVCQNCNTKFRLS